ncbi:3-polyprenyl-4-hydroxybenzoate decarboxylase [Cenarchaeum symbiosum A]|uniref:Anhydromevalonate phosphate decarboxylase n=1 Tax=Cenarchaeum symbiosum (strain A) TaxID=414004 RepID=A0RYC9_CENSY|nr:3-polyprenyl-4-hydroxybenzoate decarboxylase [Cenarchaeum symbiosum A]
MVKKPVSKKYEIAAVTARADGSDALLFENVRGSGFRVVSNLVGTRGRFARAIGSRADKIHEGMAAALAKQGRPRMVKGARFLENTLSDASGLPVVTHFEKEPGPFITSSIAYARNPDTGAQNSSFHRLMPIDGSHFSIRMVEGRHLHRCFVDAAEHGEDLKVAVVVGVHPAVAIAGAYQADWGKDEMELAAGILGGRLSLAQCPQTGLNVPAGSEIVMEGRILRDRTHEEWMVEMLQTYDHKRKQPVFELDRLHHRDDPIFHDVLAGYSEHRLLMGMPVESKINTVLKGAFPGVRGVSMTGGGCSWLHAVVQASKKKEDEPRKIIKKTFEAHRSLKQVTVVDEDIDPGSAEQVEYAMATRFQADRDLVIIRDVRGSSLDPSSDQKNLKTAKMGIDATRPLRKRPEGFEIARIPGLKRTSLENY